MRVPKSVWWLFPDADPRTLDTAQHARGIIPRILERGRLADVAWLLRTYGEDGVHAFLRDVGSPELSPRTLAFWRAYFRAREERWPEPPSFRTNNAAPWPR